MTCDVMAVLYLSEDSARGELLPSGLRTLHLNPTCRRIERSGLDLLFLSFALVDHAVWSHRE